MSTRHENGLTFIQWIVLAAAFVTGVGGVYVLREIFPAQTAHAAVVTHHVQR